MLIWNDDLQGFEIPDEKAYKERREARMDELHEALYNHKARMEEIKKEFEKRRNLEQPAAANLEINPELAKMAKELDDLENW